jgi:hypothetical protein
MTGPKVETGKWEPPVCNVCGWPAPSRNPAEALEQLERHLEREHGVDI